MKQKIPVALALAVAAVALTLQQWIFAIILKLGDVTSTPVADALLQPRQHSGFVVYFGERYYSPSRSDSLKFNLLNKTLVYIQATLNAPRKQH